MSNSEEFGISGESEGLHEAEKKSLCSGTAVKRSIGPTSVGLPEPTPSPEGAMSPKTTSTCFKSSLSLVAFISSNVVMLFGQHFHPLSSSCSCTFNLITNNQFLQPVPPHYMSKEFQLPFAVCFQELTTNSWHIQYFLLASTCSTRGWVWTNANYSWYLKNGWR